MSYGNIQSTFSSVLGVVCKQEKGGECMREAYLKIFFHCERLHDFRFVDMDKK